MLLELTVRLQPVAAPCRDFDPMFAEADVAGRAPRVEVGRAHVGRLELASFTEPPGAVSEEVVTTPAVECIAQTLAELEPVRFDVQGSPSVLRTTTAELRNVTVARGTRQTLPLHLFANEENTENESAANFANAICRAAPTPVLHTSPPRRTSRLQQQEFTVRRSERLARKSRHHATKPAVQAQNVMMKKLGITSDSRPPDASSFQQFTATFSSTLTPAHCEALDTLLPTGMGSLATEVVAPMMVS